MAFMKGFRDSGNGVYVIPFRCEEVPAQYSAYMACDTPDIHLEQEFVVREILPGSRLLSKYAYFIKRN